MINNMTEHELPDGIIEYVSEMSKALKRQPGDVGFLLIDKTTKEVTGAFVPSDECTAPLGLIGRPDWEEKIRGGAPRGFNYIVVMTRDSCWLALLGDGSPQPAFNQPPAKC